MSRNKSPGGYSIAAVSKLTSVSCHTLRVWERRYGFPVPSRTESGQRRYPAEVVEDLRKVAQICKEGRPISGVIADLLKGKLAAPAPVFDEPSVSEPRSPVDQLLDLVHAGDETSAVKLLDEWEVSRSTLDFVKDLIQPAMIEVGERWFRGEFEVFHERFATNLLHRRLEALVDRAKRDNPVPKATALLCTLQGDRHEGGIMILALTLELAGWRAESLGVDLPIEQLAGAIRAWHPNAIGISFVLSRNINKRFAELATITGVPVFVGGRSLTNYQGLARRHGLIPVADDLTLIGRLWDEEVNARSRAKAR